jgi:hypothetical protein
MGETAEWMLPDLDHAEEIDVSRSDARKPTAEAESDDDRSREEDAGTQQTTRIMVDHVELPTLMADETPPSQGPDSGTDRDWFSAGDGGELEWPAFARPRRDPDGNGKRAGGDESDRVRYLFPVPDATDWVVGELRYDRRGAKG